MSSVRISNLPVAVSLKGTELVPVVKDGATQRATISQLTTASLDNFIAAGTGAEFRSAQDKMRDIVNVADYGAKGDGVTDDTPAILAAIVANQGKRIIFGPGTFLYSGIGQTSAHWLGDGTILQGSGRKTTTIKATTAGLGGQNALFYVPGYGAGIESMGFDAAVTQTSGSYVFLGGPESYISDFFMNKDYRGVIMYGNVSQIRHGRFQDASPGAIRITTGGGDNSQSIFNVLMGAQLDAPNTATAGIRIRNTVALTMYNVSVIQMGFGLLIDPISGSEPVLNLFCNSCIFDNCTYPIRIVPTGGAPVRRLYFTDVWASSGVNGVTMAGFTGGTIEGVHFTNLQANLNSESAVTTGANVSEITFKGGVAGGNQYGFYFNNPMDTLQIDGMRIGNYEDMGANSQNAIVFGTPGFTRVKVADNFLVGNASPAITGLANLDANSIVSNNIGFKTAAQGSVSFPSGATTLVVPHGLAVTPNNGQIFLSLASGAAGAGVWFPSNANATDFTINVGPAPTANIAFNWRIATYGS
jgi:hypothetical protein